MSDIRQAFEYAFDLPTLEVDRLEKELDIKNADHIALWLAANPGLTIGALASKIANAYDLANTPNEWLPTALANPPGTAVIEVGDWVLLRGKEMGQVVSASLRKASVTIKNGMRLRVFKSDITHVRKAVK